MCPDPRAFMLISVLSLLLRSWQREGNKIGIGWNRNMMKYVSHTSEG